MDNLKLKTIIVIGDEKLKEIEGFLYEPLGSIQIDADNYKHYNIHDEFTETGDLVRIINIENF